MRATLRAAEQGAGVCRREVLLRRSAKARASAPIFSSVVDSLSFKERVGVRMVFARASGSRQHEHHPHPTLSLKERVQAHGSCEFKGKPRATESRGRLRAL